MRVGRGVAWGMDGLCRWRGQGGFKDVEGSPEPARGTSIWAGSQLGAAAQGRGCQSKPALG